MTFSLEQLRGHDRLYHAALHAGRLHGNLVTIPNVIADQLLIEYDAQSLRADAIKDDASTAPRAATPVAFTARLRTDEEKTPLRQICAVCEHNQAGICLGSSCCGNRVPVEVRLNLSTTPCPRSRWPSAPVTRPPRDPSAPPPPATN